MRQNPNTWLDQSLEAFVHGSNQVHLTALKHAFENLSPMLLGLGLVTILHTYFYQSFITVNILGYGFPLFNGLILISLSVELSKINKTSWVALVLLSTGAISLSYTPSIYPVSLQSFVLIIFSVFWAYGIQNSLSTLSHKLPISSKIPLRVHQSLLEMLVLMGSAGLILVLTPLVKGLMYMGLQNLISSLNLTHTLIFFILLNSLNTFIWYKGYHGTQVLSNFVIPITSLTLLLNMSAFLKQQALPYIFAGLLHTLYGNYVIFNAVHAWIKLKAQSKHLKDLTRVGKVSTFFNINETVLFGLPLVKSKTMLKGFLLINALNMILLFYALSQKWVSPLFVGLPFMVPAPLNVALSSFSWNALLLWTTLFSLDILLLHPFLRKIDQENI